MKRLGLITTALLFLLTACSQPEYYHVEEGRIVRQGQSRYFIGTDVPYAPRLASENPERLCSAVDALKDLGISCLRIPVSESSLDGLDTVLKELDKREMSAILYLGDSLDLKGIVSRYRKDPAVFSWQIGMGSVPASDDKEALDEYVAGIRDAAKRIKSLDRNHMVSTGSLMGMDCDGNIELFTQVHECPDIDYLSIHLRPYSWNWVSDGNITSGVDEAISRSDDYLSSFLGKAYYIGKPVVINEFDYPYDGGRYGDASSVVARDKYFEFVFDKVYEGAKTGSNLIGCCFKDQNGFNKTDASTLSLITRYTDKIDRCVSLITSPENWLFDGNKPYRLNITLSCPRQTEGVLGIRLLKDIGLATGDEEVVFTDSLEFDFTGSKKVAFDLSNVGPGFYKLVYSIGKPHPDGVHFYDVGSSYFIGVQPELVESPQDKQPDFDEFWDRTLAELAAVEPDYQMELLPEHSNDIRKSYRVTMKSLGGETIGGILCVPAKEGRYKAYIDYMGYGADPYFYDPSAEPECIEFLACARDQGIFRDSPRDWFERGIEDKETYYYRGAYCDVIRAIDFVASLDRTDPARIIARGDSQGGAFTWIAAALDNRIAAATPAVPFLSDYPHYAKIVEWPVKEALDIWAKKGITEEEALRTLSYFDVKNFTDRVKCPIYMAFGLQDPTCPPHTNFAGYNQVKSEKHYYCVPTCGHAIWDEKSWSEGIRKDFFERF